MLCGVAFAVFPMLSLRWYFFYPYPAIPTLFWLVLAERLGTLMTGCFAFLAGCGIFAIASPTLARGKAKIGKAQLIGLGILTSLQLLHFGVSWRDGYKYAPGPSGTRLIFAFSLIWLVSLWLLLRLASARQSYFSALAYHFAFTMWLLIYAFPWLGEMI